MSKLTHQFSILSGNNPKNLEIPFYINKEFFTHILNQGDLLCQHYPKKSVKHGKTVFPTDCNGVLFVNHMPNGDLFCPVLHISHDGVPIIINMKKYRQKEKDTKVYVKIPPLGL